MRRSLSSLLAVVAVTSAVIAALPLQAPLATLELEPSAPLPRPTLEAERRLDAGRLGALLAFRGSGDAPGPLASRRPAALGVRLLGTLWAPRAGASLASLALASGEVRTVAEGDAVLGAEVVAIEHGAVLLRRDDVVERLRPGPSPPSPPAPRPPATEHSVAREEVFARLGDLAALAREIHVAPAFRDGVAVGFRIIALARNSPLRNLDLQIGDLIRAVDGQPLDSVHRVLALAARLSAATAVELELERAGVVHTRRYRLT